MSKASKSDKQILRSIYSGGVVDKSILECALSLFRKYDALDDTRQMAQNMMDSAWDSIEAFVVDGAAKNAVKELVAYALNRVI